ncbi:MAG: thiosulfohydrolase SoxB [Burkholderiales bacterium]
MSRRDFLQLLGIAAAAGLPIGSRQALSKVDFESFYEIPKFGNVHLMHFTDCHAQLNPVFFREPNVNIGVGEAIGKLPHVVGEELLKSLGIKAGSAQAHAFTYLDFDEASKVYGRVGGFAHLSTLIQRIKASRPGALLLDGGDTWQGSGTALWTNAQDMVDACLTLGVDVMTAHWEMTYGAERVQKIVENDFAGRLDFVAQNVKTLDFEDPVFEPYTLKEINGVSVAIVGQAFPYTPIANPRYMFPDWSFGIREEELQDTINEAREEGAQVVVLLSHNGMDVDLKLASRVTGLDAIFGGHTHDGIPAPIVVSNPSGKTVVTNAGSNGKFLGVLDFDFRDGAIRDFNYRLLPVFSNAIPPDRAMSDLIKKVRDPYESKLNERLATTDDVLYRRGNFNGSFDQLILDALMDEKGAEIAFSPGFRWGTSLPSGSGILMEHVLDQTATTYSHSTLSEMNGERIKLVLEDVADNIFNPDPYYQQGGDMVRVGGLTYAIDPNAEMGSRISDMRLKGDLIESAKTYKIAGWAPVAEGAEGEPVWDVVSRWLKDKKTIRNLEINTPRLVGVDGNPGIANR